MDLSVAFAEFGNPLLFRRACEDVERHYKWRSIQLKSLSFEGARLFIDGHFFCYDLNIMRGIDKLSGFDKIARYIGKSVVKEELGKFRNANLKSNTGRIKILTWEGANEELVLGVYHSEAKVILPTQVAIWLSLLAKNAKLNGEVFVKDDSRHAVCLKAPGGYPAQDKYDVTDHQVEITIDQRNLSRISLSSGLLRVVCKNLAVVNEVLQGIKINFNQDVGRARRKIELFVLQELKELADRRKAIQSMKEEPIHPGDSREILKRYLDGKLVELVLQEFQTRYEKHTKYDLFNAITTARHLLIDEERGLEKTLSIAAGCMANDVFVKSLDFPAIFNRGR